MKKLFTLLVVILGLLISCAGLNLNKSDSHTMQFGPVSYTIPIIVPDFTSWQGSVDSIFASPRLSIVRWLGFNPKNTDEAVIVLIAGENEKQAYFVVLVYTPSVMRKKQHFYADKQYLESGKPSFVLSFVNEPPNVKKFIVMKQQQLKPKTEI